MSRPPNIVFLFPDQLRRDFLGCYGATFIDTPNIDWIADNGVRYDNAYSASPLCVPARTALLTGMNAVKNGVTDNLHAIRPDYNDAGIRTWPQLLAEAGLLHLRRRQDALLPVGRPARLPVPGRLRGQALGVRARRLLPLPEGPRTPQAAVGRVRRLRREPRHRDHRRAVGALLGPLHRPRGAPIHRAPRRRRAVRPHGRLPRPPRPLRPRHRLPAQVRRRRHARPHPRGRRPGRPRRRARHQEAEDGHGPPTGQTTGRKTPAHTTPGSSSRSTTRSARSSTRCGPRACWKTPPSSSPPTTATTSATTDSTARPPSTRRRHTSPSSSARPAAPTRRS